MGKTGNDTSNAERKNIVLQELMERPNHTITRTMLLKKYWMLGNMNEWDECILTLEATGILNIQSHANVITYVMPQDKFEELDRVLKGKHK